MLRETRRMGSLARRTLIQAMKGFVQMTSAGLRESHVHDVDVTKEAPNYRRD